MGKHAMLRWRKPSSNKKESPPPLTSLLCLLVEEEEEALDKFDQGGINSVGNWLPSIHRLKEGMNSHPSLFFKEIGNCFFRVSSGKQSVAPSPSNEMPKRNSFEVHLPKHSARMIQKQTFFGMDETYLCFAWLPAFVFFCFLFSKFHIWEHMYEWTLFSTVSLLAWQAPAYCEELRRFCYRIIDIHDVYESGKVLSENRKTTTESYWGDAEKIKQ